MLIENSLFPSQLAFIECEVPPVLVRWAASVAALFFVLFGDFYIKAYRKKDKKAVSSARGVYRGNPCVKKDFFMFLMWNLWVCSIL